MKPGHIALLLATLVALLLIAPHLAGAWRPREEISRPPDSRAAAKDALPPGHSEAIAPRADAPGRQPGQLALEIERGLVARDPRQRETAMTLLPELLRAEPARVVDMVARQPPGESRDALRDEVARQWVRLDRDAAVAWMKSLDGAERRDAARVAMNSLAAGAPAQAIYLADQFGIGRDDGSLEHLVQMWAETDLDAATRWLETQPDDARTAPLRARVELVRGRRQTGS